MTHPSHYPQPPISRPRDLATTRPRPRGHPSTQPPHTITRPASPAAAARELLTLLRAHGLTGRPYTAAYPNIGVLSLPQLTIWIQPHTLTWTRNGQTTTWPTIDTEGAAANIAHPPPSPHQDSLSASPAPTSISAPTSSPGHSEPPLGPADDTSRPYNP